MSLRIVFMGTPDFAAASLRALLEAGFEVAGVFTQPDKPRDRGMKPAMSAVKELAVERGLDVYQPASMRTPEAAETVRKLEPDILAVVAYGKILPDEVLAIPRLGSVNVHGSLLPKYRGAAPIQWAVLNGDDVSGVTTMYLAHDMDAGDIIFREATPVGEYETAGELFDRLADMGAKLLCRTLAAIEDGSAPREPQNEAEASYVGQLDKSLCPIDWTQPPRAVIKHICGLNPWPVAVMDLNGEKIKVFAARRTENRTDKAPGSVVSAGKAGLEIACGGGGTVMITELQAPGKKRMSAHDYLVGHPVSV